MFKIIIFLFLIGSQFLVVEQEGKDDWQVVWSDEFNADGDPDLTKWKFSGRGSPDWARYCTDNISTRFVKDGKLYLRGIINRDPRDTIKYQTGCIDTKGKFAFKYGKIEVKARLSKGKGSWPAIWLMPKEAVYGGWPQSGEIDIMEHLNYDSIVYQTIHSTYKNEMENENPKNYNTSPIDESDFNVFGLEWYEDRLDFFVNGEKTFTYPKIENADSKQWPFDQEFYIILDQALGGAWVGEINDEDLPVQMEVDWVRVYQSDRMTE